MGLALNHTYLEYCPSSTLITVPVTASEAGEQRNSSVLSSCARSQMRFLGVPAAGSPPIRSNIPSVISETNIPRRNCVYIDVKSRPINRQSFCHFCNSGFGNGEKRSAVPVIIISRHRGDINYSAGRLLFDKAFRNFRRENKRAA